jgi:ribonuclease HII
VIYAGIDEAGYGPLLGPLCVGASAFRLPDVRDGSSAPDLWTLLDAGVCRKPRDPKRRIAVADSKKLKSAGKQPLVHLERGVLSFGSQDVSSDSELFEELGVHARASRSTPWHARGLPLPMCHTKDELSIARSIVRRAQRESGAELVHQGVAALDPPAFNALYRELANKARVNMSLVFEGVRHIELMRGDEPAFVAVDRQGGRAGYARELQEHVARGSRVRTIEESEERSAYEVGDGLFISFEIEAEDRHLPVALASMGAKFVRELFMRRLNAFFTERQPGLAPTAGYVEDGRRFLAEVKPVLAREAIPEADFAREV